MHDEIGDPSEEELRAAFEEQMRHVSVEDVILQTVATLVNLGARRLGLVSEGAGEDPAEVRDLAQAQLAIEGARALSPLCPEDHQDSIKQALSQLQLAYVRAAQGTPGAPEPGVPPDPGSAPTGGTAADPSVPAPADDASEAAERAKARSKIWTPPGT